MRLYLLFLYFLKTSYQLLAFVGINLRNDMNMSGYFGRIYNIFLGSSVGIATDYVLEGPGSNPGGDKIFRPSRPVLGPTQPPVKCVPGLSRG